MKAYDIAVIGGGPGGYVAAIRAAQAGATVCLVEQERVGGTCLNHGCIPTKALYATSVLLQRFKAAEDHGVTSGAIHFDFARAMARKDGVVEKLVGGIEQLLKGNGVDLFHGTATLVEAGRIRLAFSSGVGYLQAHNIILATGALPVAPPVLAVDGKNILTSREILAMKERPASLAVVGGGYIGCELAGILATFGVKVTVIEQLPGILGRSDRQLVREVEKGLQGLGVEILTGTAVEGVTTTATGLDLRLSGGRRSAAAKVLVAVGRAPNTAGLGLDAVGVARERGAIVVDAGMRTNVPGIFAIGDVTNIIQLAHVASYQAGVAVTNALGGKAAADYRVVPSCIFTSPEVSQIGLTEEECKERGLAVEVGRFAYQASSKALCEGEPRGSIKLIAARDDDRIVGATIVGAEASALIAEVAAAMTAGLTAQRLGAIIHAHPSLPELVMEAAEDVHGRAVHKVGRRKPQ
ncbi:MAG: dihydrolipoyl dehydrogenase [Desulfuromonadales bacterium GWD2_61_12]|nr:MAG: dihydrolipoyl dehydrogenase [Desulfuromonadales bacterium GWC2_61_20]OGR32400.1 MAG: dihydrolipoyl dehydrogenase [Desulfuromonadales bacterium GWD2_61_12]HAD04368.1 dihydrolipoyl dehydrogenase [Desulfuromonas sp.]HBT83335.1 dihydrolipoyl dehydrogenase [Desulfuromonas sp.]